MKQKKFIGFALAAIMSLGAAGSVSAQKLSNPKVYVDDRLIGFADQEPVISEKGDTLIPVRGVFEAMGATVTWYAEERSVLVKSKDNITRLLLTLDSSTMSKHTLTSITTVDTEYIELSTAPTLMNERTMIPLRVVSENVGADVDWDEENRVITITTEDYAEFKLANAQKAESSEADAEEAVYDPKTVLPYLYLEADKTTAAAGEDITVSLKIGNADKITDFAYYTGMSAGIFYDKEALSAGVQTAIVDGEERTDILSGANDEFNGDSLKYLYLIMPAQDKEKDVIKDGTIAEFKFKSVNGEKTSLYLSDRIMAKLGSDTSLLLSTEESESRTISDSTQLYIDTTPIVINE